MIVNAANPASQISRTELARIFMKKRTTWESGTAVVVVDQTERSAARAQFSNQVLGKDVAAMKSYWQQSLFSGRGVPPVEKGNDTQVAAFVAGNEKAARLGRPGAFRVGLPRRRAARSSRPIELWTLVYHGTSVSYAADVVPRREQQTTRLPALAGESYTSAVRDRAI